MSRIELTLAATPEELHDLLLKPTAKILSVSDPGFSGSNMVRASRRDPNTKKLVVELAKLGFLLYKHEGDTSFFVSKNEIPALWHRVRNGELRSADDGTIYTYTPPLVASNSPKLLVVFSSIHEDMYSASLGRYFKQNFTTIQKFIAPETGVLRIADIGGVTGAFYLDTVAAPNNAQSIQDLISKIALEEGVLKSRIVLYGGSKGATGALYHGISMGLRCLAVDPVVSDEHYEKRYSDSHFTAGGIFPQAKQKAFRDIIEKQALSEITSLEAIHLVICSKKSPQYSYIERIVLEPMIERAAFFNCLHPDINDHPDVGPKSLAMTTSLLNNLLYEIPMPTGIKSFV